MICLLCIHRLEREVEREEWEEWCTEVAAKCDSTITACTSFKAAKVVSRSRGMGRLDIQKLLELARLLGLTVRQTDDGFTVHKN